MCYPFSVMPPCLPVSHYKHFPHNNCLKSECILRLQYHCLLGSKEKHTSVDSKINAHLITDIFQKYCRLSSFIFYVGFSLRAKCLLSSLCCVMALSQSCTMQPGLSQEQVTDPKRWQTFGKVDHVIPTLLSNAASFQGYIWQPCLLWHKQLQGYRRRTSRERVSAVS